MAITYLHICTNCQESYSDNENTTKSESVCPTCIMMPDHRQSDLDLLESDGLGSEKGDEDTKIYTREANGARHLEIIPAVRHRGRPRKVNIHPNSAEYKIADRKCQLCSRTYKPRGHTQKVCVLCKDEYTKIKTAEKRDKKNEKQREKRAQDPKSFRAMAMQADRLIKDATTTPEPPKPKSWELAVDVRGTSIEPKFIELKRQTVSNYDGYWILEKTGTTHDNRPYDIRKSPITGQIAICLCNPTEVYLTDATTQSSLS